MKINRNMSAVITNKQLLRTEKKMTASMQRLSSGLKINSPGENPSGMAISNKMRAQIKALDQAKSNTTDGISVMQIADGALNEATSILQRMRELSVQAANGTNSVADKKSIQAEIDQLREEIDRISSDTEYNTKVLLDGSSDTRVYADPKEASRINISDDVPMGFYDIDVQANATQATAVFSFTALTAARTAAAGDDNYIYMNDVAIPISANMTDNEYLSALQRGAEEAGCEIEYNDANKSINVLSRFYGSDAEVKITFSQSMSDALFAAGALDNISFSDWELNEDTKAYEKVIVGTDAEINLAGGFNNTASYKADGNRIYIQDQGGFSMEFLLDENATIGNLELEVSDVGRMIIQTGGNEFQTIAVRIPEVSKESLYLDTVDVTVYKGAEDAMETLDDAIAYVSSVRARIGAYQNRLEYCENSLAATGENMTSAYSTLLDTDMAEEMTEYTQQNVLEQAAISVLSQANQIPQQVLSLLQ